MLVRMGDAAGAALPVATVFNNVIWQYMDALDCSNGISEVEAGAELLIIPNPCTEKARIILPSNAHFADVEVCDASGRTLFSVRNVNELDVRKLAPGVYLVKVAVGAKHYVSRLVKE